MLLVKIKLINLWLLLQADTEKFNTTQMNAIQQFNVTQTNAAAARDSQRLLI